MILEGLVTSRNSRGELNVAPMGPLIEDALLPGVEGPGIPDPALTGSRLTEPWPLLLRPFRSSTTYLNLKSHPFGVFHVVDDVLLLARAAIGRIDPPPATFDALTVPARVLTSACRWYEFRIEDLDDADERTRIVCRVCHAGRLRDMLGFNRAKHAVLEAAILATRIGIVPNEAIREQFAALRSPVEKTAGPREAAAFALLEQFVTERLGPEAAR